MTTTIFSANKAASKTAREANVAANSARTSKKEFYTISELAERFDVKPVTIRRMADRGELPYYTIGRLLRFRSEDVEEFLQRCKGVARNESS